MPLIITKHLHTATFTIFAAIMLFAPLARGAVHGWAQAVLMAGAAVLAASMLLEKIFCGATFFPRTAIDKPLLALVLLLGLSSLFSQYKPATIEALALFTVYAVIFYASLHLSQSRNGQRHIVYLLITVATIVALIALLKRFGPLVLPWWSYSHQLINDPLVTGPYGNHNHLAGLLEMVIPLVLSLFLVRTRRGIFLFVLLYLAGLLIITHILTLSRGGWFSLAIALSCMALTLLVQKRFTRKKLLLTIIGVVALVILFVLGSTNVVERLLTISDEETMLSMNGRMVAWQGIWQMIANHPFIGSGPGTFTTIFPQFQPPGMAARFFEAHNDYLQAMADFGLLVIPLLLWCLFKLVKAVERNFRSPSRQIWAILLGALMGIISLLVHSFTDFNLQIPANALVLVILVALVCSEKGNINQQV